MATALTWLSATGCVGSDGEPLSGGFLRFVSPADPNTRVDVFSDADGESTISQPIELDAAGRSEEVVYLDAPCTLMVSDANDAALMSIDYPDHSNAATTEVQNDGWTGASGATTLAGARTWLDACLTKIFTSLGGKDAKHKDGIGGTERPYYEVIGEYGLSPKSYGAAWDGQKDDTAAVAATIAVLKTRGGGRMILPPGVGNVSDAFAVDFAGLEVIGQTNSVIQTTVNNKNIFTLTAAANTKFHEVGFKVADSVGGNSTAYAIALGANSDGCRVIQCRINTQGADTYQFTRGIHGVNVDYLNVDLCVIRVLSAAVRLDTATSSYCKITNNYLGTSADSADTVYLGNCNFVVLDDNFLDNSGSASVSILKMVAISSARVRGNTPISAGDLNVDNTSNNLNFSGNIWPSTTFTPGGITTNRFLDSAHHNQTLVGRYYSTATNTAAALTLPYAGMYDKYLIGDGSAAVTSIVTIGWPKDSEITLFFNHAATGVGMTDGSNLVLAGNFTYNADDTLTLFFNGSNWIEKSRSAN